MPTATITAVPTYDTSPVPMPPSVGVVARITNASASADKLSRWTRIPLSPLEMLGNDRAARAVDLSKPVDMVVSFEDRRGKPNPTIAFSAAIRSLDEARAILSEKNDLVNGENGAVIVTARPTTTTTTTTTASVRSRRRSVLRRGVWCARRPTRRSARSCRT